MADGSRKKWGILILAGIGAGALLGIGLGLALSRRAKREAEDVMVETVGEIKEQAQQVLDELTDNVAALVGRSRRLLEEKPARRGRMTESTEEQKENLS